MLKGNIDMSIKLKSNLMSTFTIMLLLFMVTPVMIEASAPVFVGLEPAIVVEPDYADGELDIAPLQLVLRSDLYKRFDLRLLLINNYHIKEKISFNDLGLEVSIPRYFNSEEPSKGWYATPVVAFVRNLRLDQNKTTLALEGGYSIPASANLIVNVGLQSGVTQFPDTGWNSHFGVKVQIGRWFSR